MYLVLLIVNIICAFISGTVLSSFSYQNEQHFNQFVE